MTGTEDGGHTPREPAGVPAAWSPDFPKQRPPFESGNALAVTHGAYSQRVVGPIAAALVEAVQGDPDVRYLTAPSYGPALAAWAAAEARVVALEQWIDGIGIEAATESARGKTPPLELLRQWEASALTHRSRLGLDPLSRARLGRDVATGRAQADAALLLTRMREEAGQAGGGADE